MVSSGVATTPQVSIDPNGNLTSDGSKTYEWGANNKLLAVKQGGSTLASFSYDGEGRRSTKTAGGVTTTFAYDGLQFLEERPSVGATKRYVYGPGIDQVLAQVVSGTVSYSVTDHLGSVVRTTDSTGAPSFTREYDPWGTPCKAQRQVAMPSPEGSGIQKAVSTTSEHAISHRGGFFPEDPSGLGAGINRYGYVLGNPIKLIDPLGLRPWDDRKDLGWKHCEVPCCAKKCLEQVFGESIDDIDVIVDPFLPSNWGATTRCNAIYIGGTCDDFWEADDSTELMVLEEYSHIFFLAVASPQNWHCGLWAALSLVWL